MKRSGWRRARTLAAVGLFALPAVAIYGNSGSLTPGLYEGEIPNSWFVDEACQDQPIQVSEDAFFKEWSIDVEAVANDGDDLTFVNCVSIASENQTYCSVGINDGTADGSVVACNDSAGPHQLPRAGDFLYIFFDKNIPNQCQIVVSTGNTLGVQDPKCRSGGSGSGGSGSGGGTGGGVLGCDAFNSIPANTDGTLTSMAPEQCYSYPKGAGVLKFGIWSGDTFNVEVEDSAGNYLTGFISGSGFTDVPGAVNGTVYFKVDQTVSSQVSAW